MNDNGSLLRSIFYLKKIVGMGVSCSADRQIVGKINENGVFLEQLETNPGKYLPEVLPEHLGGEVVKVNKLE